MRRVVVAMSGGVDSSVAAALLKQEGYEVIGMMLRLWSEPGKESANRCCTPDAMAMARRVSAVLDIPFYAVDAQDQFFERVVTYFNDGYTKNDTPNPCLACNREIRWGLLYQRALAFGAEFFATGHYARRIEQPTGVWHLFQGIDPEKDQSYVLHVLNQNQLAHTLFPVGEYTKADIRTLAEKFNLPVARRTDSQDLCFLAGGDYREFLRRFAPSTHNPGPILHTSGALLGEHNGLANYTIGQRKGLGVNGAEPYYVLAKDLQQNALIIGLHADLGQDWLITQSAHWIDGYAPADEFNALVKIRYRSTPTAGNVTVMPDGRLRIKFNTPLRDITPGQAAVLYRGEQCLGGAIIEESGKFQSAG